MRQGNLLKISGLLLIIFIFVTGVFAQSKNQPQEVFVVEDTNLRTPALVQHLPDWKNVQPQTVYIRSSDDLRNALGERPIFSLIKFEGGIEAATANYDAGRLLIVEYPTPQFSIDADNQFKQFYAENPPAPPVYFRRVGNYEVFVFDAADESAANELIDSVKYEKTVQWLGEDPFLYEKAERAYLKTTGEMFISSIISIGLGLGFALCTGTAIGMFVFYMRKQRKASMTAFSDAGGMVRLNLDELSESPRLLKE